MNSQENKSDINAFRRIVEVECPDCKSKIYASVVFITPDITGVITDKTMKVVKKNILKRIDAMEINEKVKQKAVSEVNDVIIFEGDEETIVKNILSVNESMEQEK